MDEMQQIITDFRHNSLKLIANQEMTVMAMISVMRNQPLMEGVVNADYLVEAEIHARAMYDAMRRAINNEPR